MVQDKLGDVSELGEKATTTSSAPPGAGSAATVRLVGARGWGVARGRPGSAPVGPGPDPARYGPAWPPDPDRWGGAGRGGVVGTAWLGLGGPGPGPVRPGTAGVPQDVQLLWRARLDWPRRAVRTARRAIHASFRLPGLSLLYNSDIQ